MELEGEAMRLNSLLTPYVRNDNNEVASALPPPSGSISYSNAVTGQPEVGTRKARARVAVTPKGRKNSQSRSAARSKSRLAERNKLVKANRETSPQPTFRMTSEVANLPKARSALWVEVTKRLKNPKLVTVQSKTVTW